jgi:hypothetical protein
MVRCRRKHTPWAVTGAHCHIDSVTLIVCQPAGDRWDEAMVAESASKDVELRLSWCCILECHVGYE